MELFSEFPSWFFLLLIYRNSIDFCLLVLHIVLFLSSLFLLFFANYSRWCFVLFWFFCLTTWLVGSSFSQQGLNPCPWQWKRGVLTTELQGSSQGFLRIRTFHFSEEIDLLHLLLGLVLCLFLLPTCSW